MIGKTKLVVADIVQVAFVDLSCLDPSSIELDTVGRSEILDEIGALVPDHRGVFPRDIAVPNREVGALAAATDDEALSVDEVTLPVEIEIQAGLARRLRRCLRRCLRSWLRNRLLRRRRSRVVFLGCAVLFPGRRWRYGYRARRRGVILRTRQLRWWR